ncbi:MAG: GIY-YIG nuclease family protein [Candidatus Omnitrophica bacterium]|nr:GIY-YIG nuclease family protein [Candidatus Omnitrophota bacterium]
MHYVYVLQGEEYKDYLYVGNTGNLTIRLANHNSGGNYSTRKYKPFRIVYYEAYLNKQDALDREIKLKHHGSVIGHFKRRIRRSLA